MALLLLSPQVRRSLIIRTLAVSVAISFLFVPTSCSDPRAPGEDVGRAPLAYQPVLGPVESGWRLPSSGDYNNDGMQDVLWRDHEGNRIAVSLMRGTEVLQ